MEDDILKKEMKNWKWNGMELEVDYVKLVGQININCKHEQVRCCVKTVETPVTVTVTFPHHWCRSTELKQDET